MIKFRSKKDGFLFETIEGSIHYEILLRNKEFEIVKDKATKKSKKTGE